MSDRIQLQRIFDVGDTYYGHFFDFKDDSTYVVGADNLEDLEHTTTKIFTVTNDGYVKFKDKKNFIGRFSMNDRGHWFFADMVDKIVIKSDDWDLLRVEVIVFQKLLQDNVDWSYVTD